MSKIEIKLMAEYGLTVVWLKRYGTFYAAPEDFFDFNPGLKGRIRIWAEKYDATLDADDPHSAGFSTPEAEQSFEQEGRALAREIKIALGDLYSVTYFSEVERRIIEI